MVYKPKIIPKKSERGTRPNVEYRIKDKLHCAGGVQICSHEGCEIYGIVKDENEMLCFRHYKERHMQVYQDLDVEMIEPKPRSLFKRRPQPGSIDY